MAKVRENIERNKSLYYKWKFLDFIGNMKILMKLLTFQIYCCMFFKNYTMTLLELRENRYNASGVLYLFDVKHFIDYKKFFNDISKEEEFDQLSEEFLDYICDPQNLQFVLENNNNRLGFSMVKWRAPFLKAQGYGRI